MARLTQEQWEEVRAKYEVNGLSLGKLEKLYPVTKQAIAKRVKSEGWVQGSSSHLVGKKVNAVKELQEVVDESSHLSSHHQKAIDDETDYLLEMEGIFKNDIKFNQIEATRMMRKQIDEGKARISDLNQHSQITARNKEQVMGKSPDTAIQINNVVDDGSNEW